MLQNLRDNLKGTVAIVVIVIFVVPLVLFGVEQLFVGSIGGTDVASVNGEGINKRELERELILEKNRLQQQMNLEANSPRLEDSALMGPVLDRIVQREALLQAAKKGGMGAAKEQLWDQVRNIEAFQVDGQFDRDLFKERISYLYTPATFLDASAKDYILNHLNIGISGSSFVTDSELVLLASITQQKRTFYSIEIARGQDTSVDVSDDELRAFYQENSAQYLEPESVVVDYVELSLAELAKNVQVPEADIKAVYDAEVEAFKADPKYVVAHILLEDKVGQADKITELSNKLASGEAFGDLAKAYSDDLGSKTKGGDLGVMIDDSYPKEFVEAVKSLTVGAVSGPIETDAGTHFIKLKAINNATPPSFEEREQSIKQQLARQAAQEEFILKSTLLDERTFGSDSLQPAAEALGVDVKTTSSFTRRGGVGLAASREVIDAAFAEDVLKQSHNSRVLNLEGDRAVVLRLKKHQPELLKPFDSVKEQIRQRLIATKLDKQLQEKADALIAQLSSGGDSEQLAAQHNWPYALHESVSRSSFDGNPAVAQKVFSLPRPVEKGKVVIDKANLPGTGIAVVGLLAIERGDLSSMDDAQRDGTKRQLTFQMNRAEMTAFEQAIIQAADIDKPEL